METKESTIKPTTLNVKGSELPAELARRAGVSPDQSVWITVSTENPSPKARMRQILRRSRAYAQDSGLTEEKLEELLKDD
jgi:predicted DNA-binding protein (MmcQ/YjbR family)